MLEKKCPFRGSVRTCEHVTKLFLEPEFQHIACIKKINIRKGTFISKIRRFFIFYIFFFWGAATYSENVTFQYYAEKDKKIF